MGDVEKRVRACVADPLWPGSAEVSKRMLLMAADEMASLKKAAESAAADRDALHADWDRAFGKRSFGEVAGEMERLRADVLTPEQINRCREWFDSVMDTNPGYLERGDYELALIIYEQLKMRPSNALFAAAREPSK